MRIAIVDGYGVKLRVKRNSLVVETEKKRRIVPLAEIDRIILITGGISITTKVIRLLARYGIDILVLDSSGKPIACMVPPWITATVDTRRAQYLAYFDGRAIEIAKSFAIAKIVNQASYVRYLAKTLGIDSLREDAEDIQKQVEKVYAITGDIEEARKKIMGIEGTAARIYWSTIAEILPRDIGFSGRDQEGIDIFNRCLNYLYGVLYGEVFRILTRYGLDPYAGFLHIDRSGKPVLTFDFIEMFRVSAVDSLLIKLLRNGWRPSLTEDGYLSRDSRSRLVEEFYRWIERKARDQVGEVKKLIEHMKSYALRLARSLRNRAIYEGFVERWWR